MSAIRFAGLAAVLVGAGSVPPLAWAQASDAEPDTNDERAVDEIVVRAQKPGDRQAVDTPYEELMRKRLLEEMETMRREQDEIAWRRGPTVSEPSRIKFGYRPEDRARDSRDTSLTDLPTEYTKPATIFRFEF
jgi:hypothetical protein